MQFERKLWKGEAKKIVRKGSISLYLVAATYLAIPLVLNLVNQLWLNSLFLTVLKAFVTPVLLFGFILYCMQLRKQDSVPFGTLFDGFANIGKSILLQILRSIRIGLISFLGMFVASIAGSSIFTLIVGEEYLENFLTEYYPLMEELMYAEEIDLNSLSPEFLSAMLPFIVLSLVCSLVGILVGWIWSYRYRFAFYNLCRDSSLSPNECLKLSKSQTKGARKALFVMDLSFLGWYALSVVTCGVLYVYVAPLITETELYYYEACNPVPEKVETDIEKSDKEIEE